MKIFGISIWFFFLLFAACDTDKSACLKSVGEQVKQERTLNGKFTAVKIEDDIDFLVLAGLHVDIKVKEQNQNHYAILPEKGFKELSHLKSLTESDHADISRALYQFLPERDARSLVQKLETLYDFQRLGIRALRRNALERIDDLEKAKKEKHQVILENYTSNSGEVRSRKVECFFVNESKSSTYKVSKIITTC